MVVRSIAHTPRNAVGRPFRWQAKRLEARPAMEPVPCLYVANNTTQRIGAIDAINALFMASDSILFELKQNQTAQVVSCEN